jgi:hypothetical protein
MHACHDIAGYWCVPDAGAGPGGRLLNPHLLLDVCLLQVRPGGVVLQKFSVISSAWSETEPRFCHHVSCYSNIEPVVII